MAKCECGVWIMPGMSYCDKCKEKLENYREEKAKWDSMSDDEKDIANSVAERNSRIAFTVIVLVAATIASGYFSEWNNIIMIVTFCVLAGVSFKFWSIIGRVVRGIVIASFCSGIGGVVGFIIAAIAGWQWEEASGKAVTIICAVAGFALGVYGGIKFRVSAEPARPTLKTIKSQRHFSLKRQVKMKKMFFCLVMTSVMFFAGCGIMKNQVEDSVRASFEEQMRNHDTFGKVWKREGAKVENVTLIKNGQNKYDGIVAVSLKGKTYQIAISVTTDGKSSIWQTTNIAPFAFLMEYMSWDDMFEIDF
ncbi:MAG: hypothetical protein LBH98_08800 [Chitinispirillales bacterium]|jgi:cell division protein FtsB|nr:hypothetical protein [Chitinispirillales bacterium]